MVVFDLDGTLVDSRRDIAESANELLAACGTPPLEEAAVGGMVGDGAARLVVRIFEAVRRDPPPDALARFLDIYERRLLVHTRPYDGIVELLTDLSRRMRLGVLTNKPLAATRRILDGLDLTRFFPAELVIGGDGPFPRKPDPAGLLHLAASAEAPVGRTLLVGDSLIDWKTAIAAGRTSQWRLGARPLRRATPTPIRSRRSPCQPSSRRAPTTRDPPSGMPQKRPGRARR